jgi:hypothetical protein
MGIPLTPISNNQTFGTWLQRTNDLVSAIAGNVVTTDSSVGGSVTTGNAFVNGTLGATLHWCGNSSANTYHNTTSFFASFGFAANSLGVYHNNFVYANGVNVANVVISNGSGFFTNSITTNVLAVATTLSVNSTAVNVSTLTASANVVANNATLTSNLTVGGSVTLGTTTLSIGATTLSAANLVLGTGTTNPNVYISNGSGSIALSPTFLTTSFGISGNTTSFYTNNHVTNNITVNTAASGNSTGWFTANLTCNNVLTVGNSSVNTVANSTTITVANVVATNLYVNSISVNNFTLGTNLTLTTAFTAGNSTVNSFINSTSIVIGNATFINLVGNTRGIWTNGDITVSGNLYVSGNITSTGTTTGTGDYIPSTNNYNLGNTTNRWTVWMLNANVVGNVQLISSTSTLLVGNASVNASVNSTIYTGTSNNANYVGGLIYTNVVSNAQLSANLAGYPTSTQLTNNLANYPTSTQLTNNLANYQTTAGLNANVDAHLPNYTGVLNASSFSIGNSTVNLAANSTTLFWKNSTVTFIMGSPTATQVSNGQYYYDSAAAWTLLPTQYGNVLTTGTTTQNIDSWLMASWYAAEYFIDVGDNNANNRTLTKILLTHDSNNSYITEYATVATNSAMGVFETTTNSTVVTLNFTPVSTNTTVRWARTII